MSADDTPKGTGTRLVHVGRAPRPLARTVNAPIQGGSTVLFESGYDPYRDDLGPTYGRMGLEPHRTLEAALCDLENAAGVTLTPSGLSACTLALSAVLSAGDHLLLTDSVYGPTRSFCLETLKRYGVDTTLFPPRATPAELEARRQPNTKAVFLESPGSLTFELNDLQGVAAWARTHSIYTLADNTWGAGLLCKPIDLGIDLSIQALTKYVIGTSAAMAGSVAARTEALAELVYWEARRSGLNTAPEAVHAAQTGLRSLHARLPRHAATAQNLVDWLKTREEVETVLWPADPDSPDHALWKRDFTGCCGLFGFTLKPVSLDAQKRFFAGFNVFGHGYSWGGFESLILPCDPQLKRAGGRPFGRAPLVRVHAGLEDAEDLIADLDAAFGRLAA